MKKDAAILEIFENIGGDLRKLRKENALHESLYNHAKARAAELEEEVEALRKRLEEIQS